ncbi:MAG: preprotein translocase subunit SecA [Desulfohalobiaceae bacterium]|nr:preprotein translocase subunit SecA [Desulfohalobiaceae bacterium]
MATAGLYPERKEAKPGKMDRFAAGVGGVFAPWIRPGPESFYWIIKAVRSHAQSVAAMSDEEILKQSRTLGPLLRRNGFEKDLVGRAFALVREAAERTLGTPHFDIQLVGGLVLLKGMITEMETGEGKTLTATLAASTLALAGVPVHIITVNDYLAQRDASWMEPIYQAMGLRAAVVVHGMHPAAKRDAYRADITYCTNKEVCFDYLRDRIVLWDRPTPIRLRVERLYGNESRVNRLLLSGLHFGIVDEADSVLIDEARTPLIISSEGGSAHPPDVYRQAIDVARGLKRREHYALSESEHLVELTAFGKRSIRAFDWDEAGFEAGEEQKEELIRQALMALNFFNKDKQYLIKDGKIQIIDEYTGRLMADRSWERGLHQLIEAKEGCEVTVRRETKARISYQRFFRRYLGLAGMTGTAREVAGELWSIYRLPVVTIPTHKTMKRRCLPDRVFRRGDRKCAAVVKTVSGLHEKGRPVLVGTRSVEASEHLSRLLEVAKLPHKVLNARQDKEEAEIISEAGRPGKITVATNMAGRGTDIRLGSGVAEIGGLYVLATERHDSRRIDRQLFGRCGRQGDPGSSETFVSLEDELVAAKARKLLLWTAAVAVRLPGRFWGRWFCAVLFSRAQYRAERLHARTRRDLLNMDEQMSESLAFTGRTE